MFGGRTFVFAALRVESHVRIIAKDCVQFSIPLPEIGGRGTTNRINNKITMDRSTHYQFIIHGITPLVISVSCKWTSVGSTPIVEPRAILFTMFVFVGLRRRGRW